MHVVPAPLAAPHQIRPPTQAGPTAGAAGQVHVAVADAAGLLLQGGSVHKVRECNSRAIARQVLDATVHAPELLCMHRVATCGPASCIQQESCTVE